MNRQRKVVITITYNEMGIIIDTKAEELDLSAQPTQTNTPNALNALDCIDRQADCEYCHEDSDGYVKPIEKNCHAFIRFGMNGWEISLSAKGWHGETKINYCPMCGRRLE